MSAQVSFEGIIERLPAREGDLMNRYSVMVYRYIQAGVCGPASETVEANGMGGVVNQFLDWGFEMADFPNISSINPNKAYVVLEGRR